MKIISRIQNRLRYELIEHKSLPALKKELSCCRGLVVLCYHTMEEKLADYPFCTHPDALNQHLSFLKEIFDVMPASEAIQVMESGTLASRRRPVAVITFDDGFRDNLYIATPLLEKYNLPALLFPVKDHICRNRRTYMNQEELRVLSRHTLWKIGAHSVSHNSLYSWVQEDLEHEITESKIWLSELTGYTPDAFAYPQGKLSARIVAAVRPHFSYAFTVTRHLGNSYDRHQIRRICLDNQHDDLTTFAKYLAFMPWEREEY